MDLDQPCLSEYGSRITQLYRSFDLCGRSYLLTSSSTRDGWVRRGVIVDSPYRDVVRIGWVLLSLLLLLLLLLRRFVRLLLRLGRLAVVLVIMALRPEDGRGSTSRGVHPIRMFWSFASIRLDRVGPPHRDVDAGQSRVSIK